ncbi:uncharacterized protein At5g43822-like [Camellia sinensis]|uniref:uncharacterized protein At5g43822-like n=1 Tax=Camellia sinensis TaxID=4442 RepID=UPI001036AC7C|nr:uncharacterized protein At5g43822-like [Camellia sinensis]
MLVCHVVDVDVAEVDFFEMVEIFVVGDMGTFVIQNLKNYGALKCIAGIEDLVLRKQMESLESILLSMNQTLEEFHGIVFFLNKILCDGRQLVKAGSIQAAPKQLQQRIGIKPSLADCLDGLSLIYEMHQSEYGNYSLLNVLHFPPPHCK